ncbi:MAG: hypothetical protein V4631_21925 [Pseudomonadota bacterium]
MKTSSSVLVCLLIATLAPAALASSALPQLRFNAVEERTNAPLTIDAGMVAAINGGRELNGLMAETDDFKGKKIKAFIVFADSVTAAVRQDLMASQGRIGGTLQCKRIRMGDSPDMPAMKTLVLADECTIKALKK